VNVLGKVKGNLKTEKDTAKIIAEIHPLPSIIIPISTSVRYV
jgi:hypothetical protein